MIFDYFVLLKFRVMLFVVFIGFVGMMVVFIFVYFVIGFVVIFCFVVGVGVVGVLNMWYEVDLDVVMK